MRHRAKEALQKTIAQLLAAVAVAFRCHGNLFADCFPDLTKNRKMYGG